MNPQDLLARIEKLEREIAQLRSVTSIPRDIETAFKARLKGLYAASNQIGTYTEANLKRTINLTGNAQSIEVLEYPAGYIPVSFQGSTYKVPYFIDS